VKLQPLTAPESEFDHSEKGDALYAMELTLSLEVPAVNSLHTAGWLYLSAFFVVPSRSHTTSQRHDIALLLTCRS